MCPVFPPRTHNRTLIANVLNYKCRIFSSYSSYTFLTRFMNHKHNIIILILMNQIKYNSETLHAGFMSVPWSSFLEVLYSGHGLPRWRSDIGFACQCRRHKRCIFEPWVGKISWSRKWQPTPVSCPENPMDRGAWWTTVYGVKKSWT